MNVSLTKKQEEYIASQVSGWDYQNASELVREALRLHQLYRNKVLQELQQEIAKGWDNQASSKSVLDIVAEKQERYRK